jgi:hypothetical protein
MSIKTPPQARVSALAAVFGGALHSVVTDAKVPPYAKTRAATALLAAHKAAQTEDSAPVDRGQTSRMRHLRLARFALLLGVGLRAGERNRDRS